MQNKVQEIGTNELQVPEQMQVGELKKKAEKEEEVKEPIENDAIEDNEEAFKFIRTRYCHEKKKIIFIMYTVRKLRNLSKLKYIFN